jgi:hypothetical protein
MGGLQGFYNPFDPPTDGLLRIVSAVCCCGLFCDLQGSGLVFSTIALTVTLKACVCILTPAGLCQSWREGQAGCCAAVIP